MAKKPPKPSVISPARKRKLMKVLGDVEKAHKELSLHIKKHKKLLQSFEVSGF
jgi:hypothetical protein